MLWPSPHRLFQQQQALHAGRRWLSVLLIPIACLPSPMMVFVVLKQQEQVQKPPLPLLLC